MAVCIYSFINWKSFPCIEVVTKEFPSKSLMSILLVSPLSYESTKYFLSSDNCHFPSTSNNGESPYSPNTKVPSLLNLKISEWFCVIGSPLFILTELATKVCFHVPTNCSLVGNPSLQAVKKNCVLTKSAMHNTEINFFIVVTVFSVNIKIEFINMWQSLNFTSVS